MVFHTMVMQLPQSLRVVGGTGLLLGIAALPVVLKNQSGGRGMEAFSSEKPEMVEKLQDQQKKERYLGGDQKR